MAVTDAYADNTKYKAAHARVSGDDDSEIDADLAAVSRYIDWKCERFFSKDAGVVSRLYVPQVYTDTLYVDDIASTAGLLIKVDTNRNNDFTDESAFAASDYELRPLNAPLGPDPRPYTHIVIPYASSKGAFLPFYKVQVTAIFGYPSIPKAIERATIQLTGILRLESPRATQRVPESMNEAFSMSPKATDIIGQLMSAYARPSVFS